MGLTFIAAVGLAGCDGNGTDPEPLPGEATNLQVSVEENTATATWSPGANVESQRAELAGTTTGSVTLGATESSHVFSDLEFGGSYSVQVVSVNPEGETRSNSIAFSIQDPDDPFVRVTNDVLSDQTWTSDKVYILEGVIFVGRDVGRGGDDPNGTPVTLTIEPGTTIVGAKGVSARGSYLVVSRGSQLIADAHNSDFGGSGQCERPAEEDVIVFTSVEPRGQRARGDWGGLIINGRAPSNAGDEAEGEGDSGTYGGPDEMDGSGVLRGVRVEFAGDDVTANDQLNGIAYQGVGHGTTVCYVQVHHNVDDGTEPFGVGPTQTHMVMTGIGDDSFDGTDGYNGFLQFGIAQQVGDDADNGFEFSSDGDETNVHPRSTAVVANVTLVGAREGIAPGNTVGPESDVGVLLREGSHFRLYNNIVTGFGSSGFDVEGALAAQNADNRMAGETDPNEALSFENNILWNNAGRDGSDENFRDASGDGYTQAENKQFFEQFNNLLADPQLPASAFNLGSLDSPPDFTPAAMPGGYTAFDVSALNDGAGLIMPTDGRRLVATDYAGAVAPGTALKDSWYFGWTVWSEDGSDSRPNHEGQ
ncbi:MAG: fibronectin type III domain-containing protein [Longimicrobiaceae bacterium]